MLLTCLGGLVSGGSSLTVPQPPTLHHSLTSDTHIRSVGSHSALAAPYHSRSGPVSLKWEEEASGTEFEYFCSCLLKIRPFNMSQAGSAV